MFFYIYLWSLLKDQEALKNGAVMYLEKSITQGGLSYPKHLRSRDLITSSTTRNMVGVSTEIIE